MLFATLRKIGFTDCTAISFDKLARILKRNEQ